MRNSMKLMRWTAWLMLAGVVRGGEIPATWQTMQQADGVIVHTIESPYQSGPTELHVLLPDNVDAARRSPVLFVLPVESGQGDRWGNGIEEVRRHDLHNRQGLICVMPTFADLPWYADHPTDPMLRQESHLLDVILPLLEAEHPLARSDRDGRLLVGFSKSGWGAWSLLLRHPDRFGRAAAWDAPLAMTWPSQYGSQPIFGTAENFAEYELTRRLASMSSPPAPPPRLIHLGYGNFRDQHEAVEETLRDRSIPHVYRDGPQRAHHWNSGWLPEAVALLLADETETGSGQRSDVSASWSRIDQFFTPPAEFAGELGRYRSPLLFADGTAVQTADEWSRRREELLTQWQDLLGHWPALVTEPEVEVLETTRRENFDQHRIRFRWTPSEFTTGYLLIPDGDGRRPAVVTVYYEPETAIGLGQPDRDFALELARRGFVTLSIGTTEATAAQTYGLYYPSLDAATVQPLSMLAYAAANAWYVLADRPEVDAERIGIVGHSFGGKWAMFASCLFDKFACAAWSDPGIVFDEPRPSVNYWEPWYLGYHPPPWRPRGLVTPENPARGLYPRLVAAGRDLQELHALMAPRPFLVSGGSEDDPARWVPLNHTIAVNRLLGHTHRVGMTNRPEHAPNAESNAAIYDFFSHFLQAR